MSGSCLPLGLEARLVIHVGALPDPRRGSPARLWSRLASAAAQRLRWPGARPTQVRIEDLQGHPVFAAADLAAKIDVPLRAGTYHITACRGGRCLQYTVTLAQGGTCDLYPRMAACRQSG
jgi:hypothetical protein